jgi:hypothetical protein
MTLHRKRSGANMGKKVSKLLQVFILSAHWVRKVVMYIYKYSAKVGYWHGLPK